MKKFTNFWQLLLILLLSTSVVFAQKLEKAKISTSAINPSTQILEKYSDDQIKDLKEAGYFKNNNLKDEKEMQGILKKAANKNEKNAVKNNKKNANISNFDLKPLPENPNPSEAFNWIAYAVGGEETSLNWPVPERATFFEIYDFCLEGPVTIEQVSHLFYEHPSYLWPDATFHFKIYDADGATLLHESVDLEAENYVEYFYTLPTPLVVTDDFWVAVVPVDASGHPSSMSTNLHDGHTYNGSAGSWTLYEGFEYITGVYVEATDAGPRLTVTPGDPFAFGPVEPGTSKTQIFTLENYCPLGGDLTITTAPDLTGDAVFTIVSDNGAPYPTLLPTDQATIEIEVQFSPTLEQLYSTVLNIYDNLSENTTSINITGFGATFGCDWYIVGEDLFGDSWNGGSVEVWQDGFLTFTFNGPAAAGPDTAYFGIIEGATLDLVVDGGPYPEEMVYEVFNNFDESIFASGPNPVGTTGISATCIPPACPTPINLATSAITLTGARAAWDAGGTETAWNFEWGPAGFSLGSGTPEAISPNTGYIFPTLTPGTYYDWYVQADCGSSTSSWLGPVTFRTDLPLSSLPIIEDFESPSDDFNITGNAPGNGVDWVIIDTASVSPISSAYNPYGLDQENILDLLVSADLTAKVNAQLSFWHVARTEGEWDHCFVEISTDGGFTYAPIPAEYYLGTGVYEVPPFNNDPPNDGPCFDEFSYPEWATDNVWKQEKFNLVPYNAFSNVTFRFRLYSDAFVLSPGWMIDDIRVEEVACPAVTGYGLDEVYPDMASISWNSLSGTSNIEWDIAGFALGTGNMITGNVTGMATLTPLQANTTYDVYIQDDCGGGETSDWAFFSFTTGCVVCPVGSTPEGEICGDSINNGCNLVTPLFGSISNGETICGNTWDNGTSRDTDWYEFTTASPYTRVTIIAESDIALVIGNLVQTIPGVPGCGNIAGTISPLIITTPCDVDTLIYDLDAPGTYYIFAGQASYVNNVCPGSRYWFSLELTPIGPPVATIDPTSFDETVVENGSAYTNLSIGNAGEYMLDYNAEVLNYGYASKGSSKDVLLSENFDAGIPVSWTIVDGGTSTDTWFGATEWNGGTLDGTQFALVDSDAASYEDMDEELISPEFDATGFTFYFLEFDQVFWFYSGSEVSDVDVWDGSAWQNVYTESTADHGNFGAPEHQSIDITAYANSQMKVRFHYYNAYYDYFWAIDNVEISGFDAPTGWLTLNGSQSETGVVYEGDDDDNILVGFDATGLPPDVYTADIVITSTDPASPATIPVMLTVVQGIAAELTVVLEGPHDVGGTMLTDLNTGANIPLAQPYNPSLPYYLNPAPVWLYAGTETVAAIPAGVVDWVVVQVRDAVDAASASSATIEATQAAFLLSDGSIVGLDGMSRLGFPGVTIDNDLFMVVYHRNHLGVMSANALTAPGGFYSYDYSAGESQVYGGTAGHKELEPGVWGMIAADGDANGTVQLADKNVTWFADFGASGYLGGDFDMNGVSQLTDKNIQWLNNLGTGGQVPAKGFDTNYFYYKSQIPK